jgi:hypothetical protein
VRALLQARPGTKSVVDWRQPGGPTKKVVYWAPPADMPWQEQLDTFGACVVPGVLTEPQAAQAHTDVVGALEYLTSGWDTPFRAAGTRDELRAAIKWMFPSHAQLFQYPPSLGQCDAVWRLRYAAADVFAKMYNVNKGDLITSIDGVSVCVPPELSGLGWQTTTEWLHLDTSYLHPQECVQGLVNCDDVHPGDATLTVLLGSHKLVHAAYAAFPSIPDSTFYMLKKTPELKQWYLDAGCEEVRVLAPRGSFVGWNTRTVHSGCNPIPGREQASWRVVVYACMMLRTLCTPAQLARRVKIFEEGRMTGHYAIKPSLFGKTPRTYGATLKPVTPLPKHYLTPLGRRLVGYST